MRAVLATGVSADRPLSRLAVDRYPLPEQRDGWTRVRVRAASLNHHDLWTLKGVGLLTDRFPRVLGCDGAGELDDGSRVVLHSVMSSPGFGDETFAADFSILSDVHDGTFADYVTVPDRNLIALPGGMSFSEAACLPVAYLTAYRMLFSAAGIRPGQRVLVQGSGGGVTTAAILLARAAGCWVAATSRDERKRELALDLGAQEVHEPGGRLSDRVDVVIETVGEATWRHSLRALKPGGVVVVAGATSGNRPPAELDRVFYRQLRVVGASMGTRDELEDLVRMLNVTGVRPVIDTTFPLEDAPKAFERMQKGSVTGKIVLTNPA
jgi:NADPH:quinone reductase-like Zn-dependent oxidoreductase